MRAAAPLLLSAAPAAFAGISGRRPGDGNRTGAFPPPHVNTPAPPPPPAGPGCGGGHPSDITPGKVKERTISITDPDSRLGTYSRNYLVTVPKAYTGTEKLPVVLFFHGWCGGWPADSFTKFHTLGNSKNFITVKPKGMSDCTSQCSPGYTPDDSISWNMYAGGRTDICKSRDVTAWQYDSCRATGKTGACNCYTCYDDVWFIAQLLKTLERDLCVDAGRLYATGESNGAMFLYPLAAQLVSRKLGPRLAAIAPWYGSPFKGMLEAPSGATPIMLSHGVSDTEIPVDSRESDDGYYYTPMNETLAAFAKQNGCGVQRQLFPPPGGSTPHDGMQSLSTPYSSQSSLTSCYEYAGCPKGGSVVLCYYREGHGFWETYSEDFTWWFFSEKAPAGSL